MFENYAFVSGDYSSWPRITKDITQKELQYIHKKIWWFVMSNGREPDTPYCQNCELCEYVNALDDNKDAEIPPASCEKCPIEWPNGLDCAKSAGLYQQWLHARNEAVSYARQIANLKWKGENNGGSQE